MTGKPKFPRVLSRIECKGKFYNVDTCSGDTLDNFPLASCVSRRQDIRGNCQVSSPQKLDLTYTLKLNPGIFFGCCLSYEERLDHIFIAVSVPRQEVR